MSEAPDTHPYDRLTPEVVLDAVERFGFRCTGGLIALSSYENRVYLADTENEDGIVAKFYRPERWPDLAILEEHQFARTLAEREIPVVAPLAAHDPAPEAPGPTLIYHAGFRVAVYPRLRGHPPELDRADTLRWVGRFIGRIHAVAATASFAHRPRLDLATFGYGPLGELLASGMVPAELRERYAQVATELLDEIGARVDAIGTLRTIRLHGDCHPGNILWARDGPHFVDLDDCVAGPAIQDLWMLLAGEPEEMQMRLGHLLEGYSQFHDLDPAELALIEPLRGLRAVHYAAWLARRWEDPAFPRAFPWFDSPRYWEEQVEQLSEQRERLDLRLHAA